MSNTINTNINFTCCKYYLPCGNCDKTGKKCTHYLNPEPYPYPYPYYTNWWTCTPTWSSKDYTIPDDVLKYTNTTTTASTKGE